jgi:hypothetical protein
LSRRFESACGRVINPAKEMPSSLSNPVQA